MKLYQFKLLEPAEQTEIIKLQGAFLGERTEDKFTFKLYQIDDFYVEEKWHKAFNERREFISFTSLERLQPYLEVINVSTLVNSAKRN